MSHGTIKLTDELHEYLVSVSVREPEVLADLRRETSELPESNMQIGAEQGQFMALLLQLIGARRCIEVGTFTGYSTLVCALALPEDGRIIALDRSEKWTAIARRYWKHAGVAEKIDLRIGNAADSLQQLLDDGEQGSFDFMFVDADKTGYENYYELGLKLIRPGGLMAFDNVLWSGSVADPADQSDDTEALRELNRRLHADSRIDLSMVPIGDGLTLARKR